MLNTANVYKKQLGVTDSIILTHAPKIKLIKNSEAIWHAIICRAICKGQLWSNCKALRAQL